MYELFKLIKICFLFYFRDLLFVCGDALGLSGKTALLLFSFSVYSSFFLL
jgi:hypothetical protein